MLETIQLPGASRSTTRLGFGGSGLMGGLSERESLHLLETALDAGVRHFDVAPSYGHGMAERCLGKFLRGKARQVTVATKFGILPPARAGLFNVARSFARPMARHLPGVRHRLANAAAGLRSGATFSIAAAQPSLEHSLRELGIERLDLFLLHEVTAEDLEKSDLLPWLQQMQDAGKIGAYGVGSELQKLHEIYRLHPAYCRVLQFECSPIVDMPEFPGAFCIHHRAVSGALAAIRQSFALHPEQCRHWSNVLDAELSDAKILSGLLLTAALVRHSDGMVLFSSRVPSHIRANADMASDPAWVARSRRLQELIAEADLSHP